METELMQAEESTQAMSVNQVHNQIQLIQQLMKSELREGEHYGKIPGCGDKDCLYKSGAEKISMMFKMAPRFKVENVDLGGGHREFRIVTELYHIITGRFLGEGLGSCSTMESKYRYRNASRICPACSAETIIKGKQEYGGGYICFAKKGGCGAKFKDDEPAIVNQPQGKTDNPDIADAYNTVLKMGKKRSLVDAVLTVTAASDIFTQDIEEFAPEPVKQAAKQPEEQPAPAHDPQVDVSSDDDADIIENKPVQEPKPVAAGTKAPPVFVKNVFPAKFDAASCPTCHMQVKKGDRIYKNLAGKFLHERC